MAKAIQKFLDSNGKEFNTELEADASDAKIANGAAVEAFVTANFPIKDGAKRGNPHRGTAVKAILMWIAKGNHVFTVEA